MKRFVVVTAAWFILTSLVNAQDKSRTGATLRRDNPLPRSTVEVPTHDATSEHVTQSVTQTPEMWFYEQERSRWEDSQAAVRRNAEFRASQRSYRIASARWYGMSNSRPTASATPLSGSYSPAWVANSFDPFQWRTSRDSGTILLVR